MRIFTDGSCIRNPGPGGYCIIIINKKREIVINKGYYFTTNNRMELMAVVVALELLNSNCNILFTIDSKYVYNGITNWIFSWKKNNWKLNNKKLVKNLDLWKRLNIVVNKHNIYWNWINSHCGNKYNEKCDKIARISARNPNLHDKFYLNF